ncbi:MAG: chromosomal replication initiator protein DnaA [Actinobacteria bacterium]|nr:chromosomal replication initiator protein DnaA [Actinomycetota bacterium]
MSGLCSVALGAVSTPVETPVGNPTEHEARDLWTAAASLLRIRLTEAAWKTWFEGIRPVERHHDQLVLAVPSRLARDKIQNDHTGLIEDLLHEHTGREIRVELVVHTDPAPMELAVPAASLSEPVPEPSPDSSPATRPITELAMAPRPLRGSEIQGDALNERYRFEHFVIGASNRFAHAAALSVAEAPARSYNPLFIYGSAGLGKTHLLHAVGHYVSEVFPGLRVRYVSTETFMNEFVEAIRNNTNSDFKRRYREVDVLLIDDIQFLESKEGLQEEFFHTFNSLHNAHRQIVISSDRPPKSIATLEDRLRSRFEWGLITDIQPPEFETRLAILQKKAESERFDHVPREVLAFIATHIKDNVRELEGALIRVAAYASLNNTPLSEELAREVLADLLPSSEPRVITPALILEETAKMFGWTIDELIGKSRRRPLVRARQVSMYVFRELTGYSYPQIAKEFGGRDHTTVMHAVEKISGLMTEQRPVFDQVSELINRIKHGDPNH